MRGIDAYNMRMWKHKFQKRFKTPPKQPAVALISTAMENGGKEQVMMDLYHGYKKRGIRAYIVCQSWKIDAVKGLIDAPEDIFVFDNDLLALIHFLWRRDVRNLHYHYNTFGIEVLKQIGFHIIYTMHNTYTWLNDNEIHAYAGVLSNVDTVIPVSKAVQEYFCARSGSDGRNFQVIKNGVDFTILDNPNQKLPYTRDSFGIKEGDIVVGFVSSFYHAKAQIPVLGVAEKIVKDYPNVKFVFLGSKGDESYYNLFIEDLEECTAKGNIVIAPSVPHSQMACFYQEMIDILLCPTLHEGGPLVVVEAMHCGLPIIMTPTGIAEDLAQEAACLICQAAYDDIRLVTDNEVKNKLSIAKHGKNEDSIVSCLIEMIENLPAYRKKAEECRHNSANYSIDGMVDAYVRLLQV